MTRLRLDPTLLASLVLCAACAPAGSDAEARAGGEEVVASDEVLDDLRNLETAVTPLPATTPAGEQGAWFSRRRDTLERLAHATRAHGIEALRRFRERPDALPQVRSALLHVAAHNSPDEARAILEGLLLTFGDDMVVRTQAATLLPVASPQRAIELLEPILLGQRRGTTYPAEDMLLGAWNTAALALERDRVPVLCAVATDLPRDMATRHQATKLLGEIESEQGRQALEQLLVESSGNHMLRRYAAQSLSRSVDAARICPVLVRTRDNESDVNFQLFLDDLIQKTCP